MPRWEVVEMIDYVKWKKINPVEMNGDIYGDYDEIYGALTRGAGPPRPSGAIKLDNDTYIRRAMSSEGIPTIYVNFKEIMYKLRVR